MKRIALLLLTFLISTATFAQSDFRSTNNPHYWKNKLPYEGYWQQDVHYTIEAEINDSLDVIDGKLYELTYWNNSPNTLKELYFHLYQNAFQPNSHMHDLYKNNDIDVKFGKYEEQGLGTEFFNLKVNGTIAKTELDNTILKVILQEPLQPNDSIVISMQFKTYFDTGTLRRRMKTFTTLDHKHYDGVHWYPSIAVYDKKFSWTTEQHLDKEFYADFGSFDIKLTFPNDFIVDATGVLQNKKEVLPDTLRKQLDIKNFATKIDTPSVIITRIPGETKTWHFKANNVHNFAFTADPLYRIGEIDWKGIKIVTLAQEQNAYGWQKSGEFTKNIIKTYSEDFGMYAWPKIIIADAQDGMEYPMLTLDNGTYPKHQSLLAHEVGHMWFYGMVGTNETYRAMMDEGFTQFLTIWSLNKLTGESKNRTSKHKFIAKRLAPYKHQYERLYYPYLKTVVHNFDKPLNTHSSDFNGATRHAGNYGLVYYKTGVMLYNLKYVLGDTLFLNAMKHYFNQWKMAHPYPDDFRNSITQYTQTDLNWFFDQWMETTKNIDYAIESVEKTDSNATKITFSRLGEMQMPLDFIAITKNNDTLRYHIPNTWFVKETDDIVLPKWYGWGNIHKTHEVILYTDSPIKNVVIDPSHVLADVDLSNNTFHNYNKIEFDHKVSNVSDWENAHHYARPDVWYNHFDGTQVGAHIEGSYFEKNHSYSATIWGNTRLGQYDIDDKLKTKNSPIAYQFEANQKLNALWNNLNVKIYSAYNVGLAKSGFAFDKKFQKRDLWNPNYSILAIEFDFMYRPSVDQYNYLLNPKLWGYEKHNNTINITFDKYYQKRKHTGSNSIAARTPNFNSDYNYSYVELKNKNTITGKKLSFNSRIYGRLGTGFTPLESQLYTHGTSPEELNDNKYSRASGFVPTNWSSFNTTPNHFQMGGGLNLRGYFFTANGLTNSGLSGISSSAELDFQKMIGFKPKSKYLKPFTARTYLFTDIGSTSANNINLDPLLIDAGIGTAVKLAFKGFNITPLELRFDMPLYLNKPPKNENNLQSRFVVGINSSF